MMMLLVLLTSCAAQKPLVLQLVPATPEVDERPWLDPVYLQRCGR